MGGSIQSNLLSCKQNLRIYISLSTCEGQITACFTYCSECKILFSTSTTFFSSSDRRSRNGIAIRSIPLKCMMSKMNSAGSAFA